MTNEEKALQIASLNGYKGSYDKLMFRAAMEMAEWKDKEFNKINKAIVVTETYYVISFKKYEHNCEVETHKYYDYDEAVEALKEYKELYVYELKFNKIVEDKFDVNMIIKR